MNFSKQQLWERFKRYYTEFPTLGLALDLRRMHFDEGFCAKMEPEIQRAFEAMGKLEKGAIANPDEKRIVGHYWLRNPALAPTAEIRTEIEETIKRIKTFAAEVHAGKIKADNGKPFEHGLLIGIGGPARGPPFWSGACETLDDP